MSARLLPVAAGALLAVVALVVVSTLSPPTDAARGDALARGLRCPDCQALSVADSPTGSAREMRRTIDEMVSAGATDEEIRAHFVARYGSWVLLAPTSPIVWVLPFALIAVGAVGLVAWLRHGRRPPEGLARPVADEERRRLHEEAEALDA